MFVPKIQLQWVSISSGNGLPPAVTSHHINQLCLSFTTSHGDARSKWFNSLTCSMYSYDINYWYMTLRLFLLIFMHNLPARNDDILSHMMELTTFLYSQWRRRNIVSSESISREFKCWYHYRVPGAFTKIYMCHLQYISCKKLDCL